MRETFHLVPRDSWLAADPATPYSSASLGTEGFIHCTGQSGALQSCGRTASNARLAVASAG
jgi:uncharacterized protein (DUF952 family)